MTTRRIPRHRSLRALSWGAAALLAVFAVSGCYESSTDPADITAETEVLSDLTVSEIVQKVQIDDEQAAALAPVLERYRAERGDRRARHQNALRMLADASDILDQEQMGRLVDLLVEKRQERWQQRMEQRRQAFRDGKRRGEGPPGMVGPAGRKMRQGFGPGPMQDLELTAEQQQALDALREQHHAARQALRQQARAGSLTREEMHERRREMHAQHRDAVEALLTPAQKDQLARARNARALERRDRSLERQRTHGNERLTLVARILELDDEQLQAARTMHQEAITALEANLEALRSGALDAQQSGDAARALRDDSFAAFRTLLDAEQQELFDALQQLQHRRGHRFGPRR